MLFVRKLMALIQSTCIGSQLRDTVTRHQSAADKLDAAVKEVLKQ